MMTPKRMKLYLYNALLIIIMTTLTMHVIVLAYVNSSTRCLGKPFEESPLYTGAGEYKMVVYGDGSFMI